MVVGSCPGRVETGTREEDGAELTRGEHVGPSLHFVVYEFLTRRSALA